MSVAGEKTLTGFFVIEGIDGAGTTTQLELLTERYQKSGNPFWPTCEPTTGEIGKLIRQVLAGNVLVEPCTSAHLFVADRHEHLFSDEGIRAHLERGDKVISDRYLFSSLAYQTVECSFDYVLTLNDPFPLPEALFFVDVPTEVGKQRSSERLEREIFEHEEFQIKVREKYMQVLEVYASSDMDVHIIDGNDPPNVIAEKIWSLLPG